MLLSLPDDSARWEATSAHAWIALPPPPVETEEQYPSQINFRLATRSCFDASLWQTVQIHDTQHRHIIVLTLARFLWSVKELQASPLMDVVPEQWPLVEHKANLLDKLDEYGSGSESGGRNSGSSSGPGSGSLSLEALRVRGDDVELRRAVERALVVHLSHLYGASDLMDWMPALLRSAGLNKVARERMQVWAREDPVRLRRVVYHSAQILGVSRDFPFNNPFEPFYAFYAGAALWCAATVMATETGPEADMDTDTDMDTTAIPQRNTHHHRTTALDPRMDRMNDVNEEEEYPLFLDRHTTDGDADYFRILQWIRDGGQGGIHNDKLVVGVYGVPVLGSKESPAQVLEETVRVLQNMRIWDLSVAFVNVLRQLIRAESAFFAGGGGGFSDR